MSPRDRASRRAAFIAGFAMRLLVAALFVRTAFWFIQTWVAQHDYDFSYISHGTIAGIAVLYVLATIGYRLERTIHNDLVEAMGPGVADADSGQGAASPFARRD